MKELQLYNSKKVAIVLDEHYDRLCVFNWFDNKTTIRRAVQSRTKFNVRGYPKIENISLANEVMNTRGVKYDHKDLNYLNNIPSNLRPCTQAQNGANRKKQKGVYTSKYKGVHWNKYKSMWQTSIHYENSTIYLGLFESEEDAAKAYDSKAIELFGEFAVLNFSAPTT